MRFMCCCILRTLCLCCGAGNDLERVLSRLDLHVMLHDDLNASQGASVARALIWRLKLKDLKALCKQHVSHTGQSMEVLVKHLADVQKITNDIEVIPLAKRMSYHACLKYINITCNAKAHTRQMSEATRFALLLFFFFVVCIHLHTASFSLCHLVFQISAKLRLTFLASSALFPRFFSHCYQLSRLMQPPKPSSTRRLVVDDIVKLWKVVILRNVAILFCKTYSQTFLFFFWYFHW